MKTPKRTSLEVAQLAQVSQATVSRALRDSPLVKPETRARIQEIAREMHYRTDRNAAGLRTRRSRTLALLLFEGTRRSPCVRWANTHGASPHCLQYEERP